MGRKTKAPKTERIALFDLTEGQVVFDPVSAQTATITRFERCNRGEGRIVWLQRDDGVHCFFTGKKSKVVDVLKEPT